MASSTRQWTERSKAVQRRAGSAVASMQLPPDISVGLSFLIFKAGVIMPMLQDVVSIKQGLWKSSSAW